MRAVLQTQLQRIGYGSTEKSLERAALDNQFSELGLNFPQAKIRTANLLRSNKLRRSDDSLHYELFAAIGLVHSPKRVLEIGTFRGEFTAFLASLFPDAYIETWDLPDGSESGLDGYIANFQNHYRDQKNARIDNLGELDKVHQVLKDSTELVKESASFDLVWIDGDHTFPVVAFDILNALRLSSSSTWIVIDDIRLTDSTAGKLGSTEGFNVVSHLASNGLATLDLVYKRVGSSGRHWRDDTRRKHLAVLRRKTW